MFALRGDSVVHSRRLRSGAAHGKRMHRSFSLRRRRIAGWSEGDHALETRCGVARNYPQSRVEPDHIFIRDGKIWSSAGITAGIDLALAMVADVLGEAVAKRAAQQMVVYYRRPAGQSQFSVLLDLDRPSSRFSPLIEWARERLSERLGVERLAERAGMSTRNFTRVFAVETGMTPA